MALNKSFAVLALTQIGVGLAHRLQAATEQPMTVLVPERFATSADTAFGKGQFTATLQQAFRTYDCVICIMATGIVVRTIAPLVTDKTVDPAVIVIDEQANHVISLLSGHVGGANEWTQWVSELLDADPVITTATDTEHVAALDVLAKQVRGWYPEFKAATKWINGRLAAGDPVGLVVDPAFQSLITATTGFTVATTEAAIDPEIPLVVVSDRTTGDKRAQRIQVIPRLNVLGIGCRKDVTMAMMQAAFSDFCAEHQLAWRSIGRLASIEKKAHEPAIHTLAATLAIPVTFYSAAQLAPVAATYPQSDFVKRTVGVGNVALASVDLASGARALTPRFSAHEITFALGRQLNLNEMDDD